MTPLLRGRVRSTSDGASIELVLVSHPLTRIGFIAQISLVFFIAGLGALAGLRNPIFLIGALFVLVIQVSIALTAYLARRRDWPLLISFVCGAVAGEIVGREHRR